jgi:steroid 5-alpha reductase family enzyme
LLNLEFGNIEAYGLAILGLPMLILWAGVFIAMSITYIIARLINNAGLVDVFWGFSFGLIVTFFLWLAPEPSEVQIIFTGMVILASLRLGGHIGQRFIHEHPKEDPRYTAFRVSKAAAQYSV